MPVENKLKIEDYTMYDFILMTPEDAGEVLLKECDKTNPNIEVIKNILEFSTVDVNHQDDGYTALMLALYGGHKEIVQLLLKRPEIDVNLQNEEGYTALMLALENDRTEIVKLLLKRPEIKVNLQDEYGNTALMMASGWGHTEIVKLLLERPEIKVNLQDEDDFTALMWASLRGHTEIVKLLLNKKGIKPLLKNKKGKTFLDVMHKKIMKEIVVSMERTIIKKLKTG